MEFLVFLFHFIEHFLITNVTFYLYSTFVGGVFFFYSSSISLYLNLAFIRHCTLELTSIYIFISLVKQEWRRFGKDIECKWKSSNHRHRHHHRTATRNYQAGNWLWSQVFAFWRHWNVKIKSASSYRAHTFNICTWKSLAHQLHQHFVTIFFFLLLSIFISFFLFHVEAHHWILLPMPLLLLSKHAKMKKKKNRETEKTTESLFSLSIQFLFKFYSARVFLLKKIYSLKYVILCVCSYVLSAFQLNKTYTQNDKMKHIIERHCWESTWKCLSLK